MRQKIVIGNWKMFTSKSTAKQLAEAVVKGASTGQNAQVAVCPPFPYLGVVGEVVQGTNVGLGAQNAYHEKEGAFTGEVSPAMLVDMGCQYVILGHSERRHKLGESDDFIQKKIQACLADGLTVVLCLGETWPERESGRTEAILDRQITSGLAPLQPAQMSKMILAYEPVWAIGTGQTASPEQAQDAHAFLRRKVTERFSADVANELRIQYGGSVNAQNAATLFAQPDVDGGLIGGASLKADQFLAIVGAAR